MVSDLWSNFVGKTFRIGAVGVERRVAGAVRILEYRRERE